MASSSGSSRSSSCPICLEPMKDEAYLDHCFHAFCYPCISHWSRFVAKKHSQPHTSIKCPLCKAENTSIIHGFNGESFQRHYINQDHQKRFYSSAHEFRLQIYHREPGIMSNFFDVQQYWRRCRYLQKNMWLQSWMRREIQTLLQEEDVDVILHHVHGVAEFFLRRQEREGVSTHEQKRKEFRCLLSDAARPFLQGQAERFVDEVELFLASGLNIEAYDKACMQYLDRSTSGETREQINRSWNQALEKCYMDFLDEDIDASD